MEEKGLQAAVQESQNCPGRPASEPDRSLVSLEEVRVHLRLIRDVLRVLDSDGRYLKRQDHPEWAPRWEWESLWRPKPISREDKVAFMSHVLTAGLASYRLLMFDPHAEPSIGAELPSLYSALCLQIANNVSAGGGYRVCQERDCRGLFLWQSSVPNPEKDESLEGKWSSGTKFCSRQCERRWRNRTFRSREGKPPLPTWQAQNAARFSKAKGTKPKRAADFRRHEPKIPGTGGSEYD
jgi:hypothetical protein